MNYIFETGSSPDKHDYSNIDLVKNYENNYIFLINFLIILFLSSIIIFHYST